MMLILKNGTSSREMDEIHKKFRITRGVDTKKFCGVIKLKHDPLTIQKQMRNEWE
jgi:hypothetical protein